jgi:RecA-family ATPase
MKTWITIDLAVECAKGGGLWLGLFPVSDARVLFIDQERFKGETQRRFKGVMAAKGIEPATLKDRLFIKSGTTTRLDIDDSYRAFKQELLEIRPDIVIVDSFATFHVGDENDRMTIQKMLERVKELRTEIGCAFIFIDHENKGAYQANENHEAPTAGRMAGSVGKVAAAEFVLTVRRYDPTTCMVYHTKSTLGPRVPSFTTHVVDLPGGGIRVHGEGGKI